MSWMGPVISVLGAVLLFYALLLLLLWQYARKHPGTVSLGDALKLLPDLIKFFGRLSVDKKLPWRQRIAVMCLVLYLASPVDLVPDFIPLLGYTDDVVITALVLRLVVKSSGREALERNWQGSFTGLQLLEKLSGLTAPGAEPMLENKEHHA